jgi:16S rRNA (cytosine1402-N4)-methyltransferase
LDAAHVPVLLAETVELLAPAPGGLVVDCTLGLGGHAEAILGASSGVRLVGIDRDPEALARARERLAPFGDRVTLVRGNFADLAELLAPLDLPAPSGVLADLGVSSMQLDRGERGFSFRRAGPLDMRMGPDGPTAADVVNQYPEEDLERIIREYGEDWDARRIARGLVAERTREPFSTTEQLATAIARAKSRRPYKGRRPEERIDPATRVFQALRIEVNQELAALPQLLDQAINLLSQDGRLVVISYHSLEDRIVKNTLRDLARGEVDQITGRPRWETKVIEVLTKHPVRPSEDEVAANPRARSARLRAARRL